MIKNLNQNQINQTADSVTITQHKGGIVNLHSKSKSDLTEEKEEQDKILNMLRTSAPTNSTKPYILQRQINYMETYTNLLKAMIEGRK